MISQHHPSSIPSSQQLEILVDRIFNSRQTFIRIVEHLLAELRSQREAGRVDLSATPVESKRANERSKETLSDARSTPMPFRTLAELLAESTGRKRGRQMTHYDGIPISIIQSTRPATPPLTRQTATPRRLRLRQYFEDLKLGHTMESGTDKEEREGQHLADKGMEVDLNDEDGSAGIEDGSSGAGQSSNGEEDESDDDDVVFII